MTTIERQTLTYPNEPTRRVRLRIERGEVSDAANAPVAVLLHGFKGFMDWGFFPHLSTQFAEAGFVTVSMNASGCGVGDDPLVMDDEDAFFHDTYSRQLEDIAWARSVARELPGVDPMREVLFGHSRGGGMGILSATGHAPERLITWAAIDDAVRADEATRRQWRADGVMLIPNARTGQVHRISTEMLDDYERQPERFDIPAYAARLTCPFLALHGADDTTVMPEAATRLADAAPQGVATILPATDHGMNAKHPLLPEDASAELREAIRATLEFARAGTSA